MDGGFVPADWPPSREWKSTLAGNKNAKTFFIFCVELKRGKKFKVYPTTNQLKTMWIFLNFNVIRRCEFFFFFLYTRSSLWIHFPFSFIFLLPKFKEKEDVTHVCAVNREWNSMLTSLVTVFYFFFILASSYFLGIPARRHRETKKKKKKSQKKEQKKKTSWAAVSLSLSLFFFSFLNTENIIQVYVLSYYV